MWRPPITAHLLRCLVAPSLRRGRPTPQSRRSSAPRICTVLDGLGRAWVVRLVVWASFAASLSLAACIQPAWGQGDANAGKAVYELRCAGCHGVKGDGKGPA
ncbi:MAG TPA: c-type cytochrome, partial [Methylomirabilota bacterium]|nr:c-type cytochrome [Methylomirabilota bacterium]